MQNLFSPGIHHFFKVALDRVMKDNSLDRVRQNASPLSSKLFRLMPYTASWYTFY